MFREVLRVATLAAAVVTGATEPSRAQQKPAEGAAPSTQKVADRAALADDVTTKRETLAESERVLLAPAEEDLAAYADFLGRPKTGLVRLLPRETFESKLAVRGGGAYYSFTRLTHEYGYGSDISLERDQFSVGFAGANYGFIVNLGEVPLGEVTRETFGVRQLDEHRPPADEPKARLEQRRASDGFEVEGWRYRNRLPVRLDDTYAVRSVDYGTSDVLVAFRVVRKDSDGSVTLLWKLLKQYSKPKLERAAQQ